MRSFFAFFHLYGERSSTLPFFADSSPGAVRMKAPERSGPLLPARAVSACFIPAKPRSCQRHVCRGVQAEIGKVPRAVLKIPFRRDHGGVVCTELFVGNHGLYARRRAPLRKKAAQIAVRRDAATRNDGIQPAFLRRFDGFSTSTSSAAC